MNYQLILKKKRWDYRLYIYIVALRETWLTGTDSDQVIIGVITPPGI